MIAVPSTMFTYSPAGRLFVGEESDVRRALTQNCGKIALRVRSARTGRVVEFVEHAKEYTAEGELRHTDLISAEVGCWLRLIND